MFPYSIIGFFISYTKIINFLKKHRLIVVISCIYLLYFFYNYKVFNNIKGCKYQGLEFFVFSICIFISFAMFPSELIKNKVKINIIKQLTNYTSGIYYLHTKIAQYSSKYVISIKNKTIKGCIIIYLMCYIICCIGSFIFRKTKLRNLFE
jgi:membrane-bound acyltransferase YfiQ involved in biofilm formation